MNDILNFTYKRKGAVDSDIFVPKSVENNFVIFENGASCDINKLMSDFEKIDINPNISKSQEIILNPDDFFGHGPDGLGKAMPIDLEQLEQIANNPNASAPSEKLKESVSLDGRYEKVVPGGQPKNSIQNRLTDDNSSDEYTEDNKVVTNRLPEWDVFDRVKKAEEIEILIPFKIKLPRPEKIDALNDMFETSFVSYLAKQYIKDNIVNNSIGLQQSIHDAIETWMETEIYGTSKKRKPSKNTKTVKAPKTTVSKKTEEITVNTITENTAPEESTANAFFNTSENTWDGNIKKLFIINTKEQYEKVKKQIDILKEKNPTSLDLDRYIDLVEIYEMQIKEIKETND